MISARASPKSTNSGDDVIVAMATLARVAKVSCSLFHRKF